LFRLFRNFVDGERMSRYLNIARAALERIKEREAAAAPSAPSCDLVCAAEALAVLRRLKTFTVPTGRMPAAREIAQRLASTLKRFRSDGEPVEDSDDVLGAMASR
jgi:hypothetical protein